jgi:hypothetical protein
MRPKGQVQPEEAAMPTATQTSSDTLTFWSGSHHGHKIAAYRHSLGWSVYIDTVMQASRTFATLDDATRWLQRKVDDDIFDTRMAVFASRARRRGLSPAALHAH